MEGAEADVLASADLRFWRTRVIVVEATVPLTSRPSHQAWEPGVVGAGYELALFDGAQSFLRTEEVRELLAKLSIPANVLDGYIPYACAVRAGLID